MNSTKWSDLENTKSSDNIPSETLVMSQLLSPTVKIHTVTWQSIPLSFLIKWEKKIQ